MNYVEPRFLLPGIKSAQTDISLAAMTYNLKRMPHILGLSKRLVSQ
jgi:hypothetical protein